MTKKRVRLLTGFGVAILAILVFLFFRETDGGTAKNEALKYKELQVRRGTFRIGVSASGTIIPIDRVEIKSKASGIVEELPVEQGDFIKKGDLIARLDQKDEKAEFEQAQANLDIARAELKQAKNTYERRDRLFKSSLISEEELGEIELNLAVAKGKLVQAKTALERATERLSEAIVRAPIDGVILQKYVEKGQIITSGVSNVSGGTPIADIANMSSVYIEAGVDEIDIGKIAAGQMAAVVAEAYPQLRFKGRIVRIAPEAIVEQNVTLFNVVIEVENRDGKLKSGMNANVEITIVAEKDVLLAPALSLRTPQSGPAASSFGQSRGDGQRGNHSENRRGGGNGGGNRQGADNQDGGDKNFKIGRGKPNANVRIALVKRGDEFVRQEVEIGLSNFKDVVVLSGLEEGDILGVPMVSRLMQENQRLEQRIRSSRGFGTGGSSSSSRR